MRGSALRTPGYRTKLNALSLTGSIRWVGWSWQITGIFKLLAQANDVTIRVGNLKLRQTIGHLLQPARHNATRAKCGEHLTETLAFAAQINVPIILTWCGTQEWRTSAQHQLHLSLPEDGKLEGWQRGKRVAHQSERVTIPLHRASDIRHSQDRD